MICFKAINWLFFLHIFSLFHPKNKTVKRLTLKKTKFKNAFLKPLGRVHLAVKC